MTLRLLIVVPGMHPREGGPPRVVNGSAAALARQGVAVEIATTGPPEEDAETRAAWPELAEHGVPLHIFPRVFPRQVGISPGLARFVRANLDRFDLLHVHCVWEKVLADAAALFRAAGKPTLVSPHGMLDRWQLQRSALKKRAARMFLGTGALLREADGVLYGTRDEADEAVPLGLPGRTIIMPNGVSPFELGDPKRARAALLARFPQMRGWTRTLLFFSRLHPKKGLDLLVEALARVQREFPGAGLLAAAIAQDEAYEAALRARIAELQPLNAMLTTELAGPEARAVFAAADVFCLPSHQEGFSIAIVEAAGAGLPVLITDPCHMQEIAEAEAGVVVPVTVDGLEQGLRRVLSADDAELAEMGRRGRELVAANYTWEKVAERLVATYREVLGARSAAVATT